MRGLEGNTVIVMEVEASVAVIITIHETSLHWLSIVSLL
jgi:hypothetical protein